MSHNGKVQYGKWKYIPAAQSLLIDRPQDSILLNHAFFAPGACIFKKDGFKDEPWILVNERIVPDLNVEQYLESLLPETPPKHLYSDHEMSEESRVITLRSAEGVLIVRTNSSLQITPGVSTISFESGAPAHGRFSILPNNDGVTIIEADQGKVTIVEYGTEWIVYMIIIAVVVVFVTTIIWSVVAAR